MAEAEFDALTNDLENMMNSTSLTISPGCCIFKVPNILFRHKPEAYTPNAFSIGPYHYGEEHLKPTQKIKLRYLHDLISSFPGTNPKSMLRTLIRAIREVQKRARDCYAEPFNHISADEFVKILVLDGCFLIELFRKNGQDNPQIDGDPIFTMSCMRQFLLHDLILLENQIPWFVLRDLFDITTKPDVTPLPLSTLVQRWGFSNLPPTIQQWCFTEHPHKHILDMLRNAMVFSSTTAEDRNVELNAMVLCSTIAEDRSVEWKSMHSATRLREAGIEFNKGTSSKSILDIKFKDGVLEIPQLQIDENTEPFFRNLICLEQCLPKCDPRVTSYAVVLDNLINTTNDMEILCESGISDNWLNVDDATKFFNQLYDDTYVKEVYYTPVIVDVNNYCRRSWPKYRRILMHDYFGHPWALISVVAAAFLLILAILQTVFSIIK